MIIYDVQMIWCTYDIFCFSCWYKFDEEIFHENVDKLTVDSKMNEACI